MTEEDEEFNRIEREAAMRKEAVAATITKREWVGLTDDERSTIWGELPQTANEERDACVFAETIEVILKEKNGM